MKRPCLSACPAPLQSSAAWCMYVGAAVACFAPASTIIVRTMLSRCVDADEVGTVFSVTSLIDAVGSSFMSAMFQSIYSATEDGFMGAFLVVNAVFFACTVPENVYLRRTLK